MAKLTQRLGLDLADALACNRERLPYFLQRVLAAIFQTKPSCCHRACNGWYAMGHGFGHHHPAERPMATSNIQSDQIWLDGELVVAPTARTPTGDASSSSAHSSKTEPGPRSATIASAPSSALPRTIVVGGRGAGGREETSSVVRARHSD